MPAAGRPPAPGARPGPGSRPVARPPVARRPSRAARRRRRQRRVGRTLLVALLAVLVSASTFVGGLLAAPFDEKTPPPPKPVLLLAADGTQIGSIRPTQRREIVPAEAIPDVMRSAIIAAEDDRFLEHNGIDPIGIVRAAVRDLAGGQKQGGSTLTQQYVKNEFLTNERTWTRKIREAATAMKLEQRKSKEQILTDYLNVLYLGNGTYGVQAASRYYFGVDVRDLDLGPGGARDPELGLARAAMLAGIAPAPSAWNPVADLSLAQARQRYTLNQMVTDGRITPQQAGAAFSRELVIVQEQLPPPETTAPEFADMVTEQLREQYTTEADEDLLFRGGLRVTTTLDTALQEAVTAAAREVLPDANDPQAAVVALDPRNGDVKAMTTLRRYPAKTDSEGNVREPADGYERFAFNLATDAYRSTGSTLKPFTLATALMQGKSLDERRRAPACDSIPNPGGEPNPYRYCNAAGEGGRSSSPTLRQALQRSVNTVYVPLANEVGRENVASVLTAAGAQASPAFPIKTGNLSFGLGAGVEVTPLSMANAFGTLVNGGVRMPPRLLTETRNEAGGMVTPAQQPAGEQAIPAEVAAQVKDAMSGVTDGAGTAPRARQPFTVYGKTGTTNDSVDAWFIGCVEDPHHICLATWMGYEDQSCTGVSGRACGGMKNVNGVEQVFGGTLPAEIFARTFDKLREIEARRNAPPEAATVAEPTEAPAAPSRAPAPEPVEPDAEPEPDAPEPVEPEPPPTTAPPRTSSPTPSPAASSPPPDDDEDDGGILPDPGGQAEAEPDQADGAG